MFDDDQIEEPDYENANKGVFTSGGGQTRKTESPPAPPVRQGESPEGVSNAEKADEANAERPPWRGQEDK